MAINLQLLQDYLKDVKEGKMELKQPFVSIMLAGVMGGATVQVPTLFNPTTGM